MFLIGPFAPPSPTAVLDLQRKPKAQIEKSDGRVEPTSWGQVRGRIYDGVTGRPIPMATIAVQNDGVFAEKGASIAKSDREGVYKARAILGRIRNNFDVGRAIMSSGIGLLLGTANNQTRRVDVSQVNVRVEAAGYRPLQGVLHAQRQDAGKFALFMEPILLWPASTPGQSLFADGYAPLQLTSAHVEPEVVKPGDKAKLVVTVVGIGTSRKDVVVRATSTGFGGSKDLKFKGVGTDGTATFEHEFRAEKKAGRTAIVVVDFKKTPEDVRGSASLLTLIQTKGTPEEDARSLARRGIIEGYLASDYPAADRAFVALGGENAAPDDLDLMAVVYDRSPNPLAAAGLRERLDGQAAARKVKIKDRVRLRTDLLASLVEAKQDERALSLAKETYAAIGKGARTRELPVRFIGLYGLAAVRSGDLVLAESLEHDLMAFPYAGLDPVVGRFRAARRLEVAEREVGQKPNDPAALAELGRALADSDRIEESLTVLARSAAAGGGPAVDRDIAYVALRLGHASETPLALDQAVLQARSELGLGKGEKRSKDFHSWRRYALLTYALAKQQETDGLPEAAATFDEAIVGMREALSVARNGAKRDAGSWDYVYGTYASGSTVLVAGFAYAEADSCFAMLQSLKVLRTMPDEPYALYTLALSLAELGLPLPAYAELTHLRRVAPDFADTGYLQALILKGLGREDEAIETLSAFVAAAPHHPKAELLLATLYAEAGDPGAAAQARARHTAMYGRTER